MHVHMQQTTICMQPGRERWRYMCRCNRYYAVPPQMALWLAVGFTPPCMQGRCTIPPWPCSHTDLKAKSFTRNSSAPSLLPRIGQGSSSGSLSHLGRLRRATERPQGGPLSGNESSSSSRLGQGGAAFALSSPQPSTDDLAPSSSVTSFTTKRGVVRQHYVLVRHLRTILEYFVGKVTEGGGSGSGVTVSTLTSHQVREYVVANRIFPPEDKALGQYFTSNFPTPDVVGVTHKVPVPVLSAPVQPLAPYVCAQASHKQCCIAAVTCPSGRDLYLELAFGGGVHCLGGCPHPHRVPDLHCVARHLLPPSGACCQQQAPMPCAEALH